MSTSPAAATTSDHWSEATRLRRLARRSLPARWRLALALWRRQWRDRRAGYRFAEARAASEGLPERLASYELTLSDYPGQEAQGEAKRANTRRMAAALDGLLIAPGETLSLWHTVGEPSEARGYRDAAALVEGALTSGPGGGTCLLATVVYNAGLLAGLEVIERRNHSVDTYGDDRYYRLGCDATIEYGYIDLRLRNRHRESVRLAVEVQGDVVRATVSSRVPRSFSVQLDVEERQAPAGWRMVTTQRRVQLADGRVRVEDLGASWYRCMPASD
ncbi:MAG: hypothetical protein GEU80_05705 [Dehalococcoidia bacterium]|nr:hypothetical protein [Dehalococcoidia bacterium]